MKSEFLFGPVPHEEAAKFISAKPVMSRQVFDGLAPELRARAFTVTGVGSVDALQKSRDIIATLPMGENWDDVKNRLVGEIAPWMEDDEEAERRAELLLRVHGNQAYAQASWEVMDRQREVFPYWQYQSMGDGKVRDTHRALNGIILPANDPFWVSHTPPWEYGCRCQIIPLDDYDVEDIQARETDLPPEQKSVLSETARRRLNSDGEITRAVPGGNGMPSQFDVRTPQERGIPNGYQWSPSEGRMTVEYFRERYDAQTWDVFEAFARTTQIAELGKTIWQWLGGA
jgi:SPP1 gp7 family putative phage head morphogenesis protein